MGKNNKFHKDLIFSFQECQKNPLIQVIISLLGIKKIQVKHVNICKVVSRDGYPLVMVDEFPLL